MCLFNTLKLNQNNTRVFITRHDTHNYCRVFSSWAVTSCFYDLGLSRLGLKHPTFHLRGKRSNPLRHLSGGVFGRFILPRRMIHLWVFLKIPCCLVSVCLSVLKLFTSLTFPPEPQGQFQPSFAEGILMWKGLRFVQMKSPRFSKGR